MHSRLNLRALLRIMVAVWLAGALGVLLMVGLGRLAAPEDTLVFTRQHANQTDLYLMDVNSGAEINLTPWPSYEMLAQWSPDGRWLTFASDRRGGLDIYALELSTGSLTQLTRDLFPARGLIEPPHWRWSPDSRYISFEIMHDGPQGRQQDIYLVDVQTAALRNLTDDPRADDWGASWSPDGRAIAFTSDRADPGTPLHSDIYIMDIDSGDVEIIVDDPDFDGGPSWSPDGVHLLFTGRRYGIGDRSFLLNLDSGEVRDLSPLDERHFAWSPDGSQLAFTAPLPASLNPIFQHYVIPAGSDHFQRITGTLRVSSSAVWSPDGRRLAFVSPVSNNGDVYVVDVDGANLRNLTRHVAGDMDPVWSPSGQQIAFVSLRDTPFGGAPVHTIYTVAVGSGQLRRLTQPAFTSYNPAWRPAGG